MNYQEFIGSVTGFLRESLPGGTKLQMIPLEKNNGVIMDGLSIRKEGKRVAPMIYLDAWYREYLDGRSLRGICDQILECCEEPDLENRFDVDGGLLDVIAPGVELVFLCTPNNPTGRLVDGALLRAAAEQCRAVGAVLAVDECFLPLPDGAGPGLAPCLAEYPNLLLLRAFTKSYAMAGLRLGYALSANGGLLERMAAAGPPWSVSTPAQAAGLAALEQCSDWPEKARALLASERPALSDGLAALGLEVVPGQANYLLFRAAGAADLNDRILTRGVLIRSCANYHGLGNDWYRVCVGQAEQNRRLLAALKEVL